MPGKHGSRVRPYVGQFLRPISKHLPTARSAAQIISRNPVAGPRLLFRSWSEPAFQFQPDVYPFAAFLAERFGCTHAILFGRPTAKDLLRLHPQLKIVGLVSDADAAAYRDQYGFGTWLKEDTNLSAPSLSKDVLKRAVVVCTNLDHFVSPVATLNTLKSCLDFAPVCILTAADRDLDSGGGNGFAKPHDGGSSWNLVELEALLRTEGLNLEFIGRTSTDNLNYEKKTIMAVITSAPLCKQSQPAPGDFRVVAFMAAYNEEDIIVQSITKWTDQGVAVHVLENWSGDATYDLVKQLESRLPVTVERFPAEGPSIYFDWGAMLARMETLSKEIKADWFVRRGADEVLVSPWPDLNYRDALYLVDQAGFNTIDHTIIEFHPIDDGFEAGMDHESYFKHFDFKHLSHPRQRKAWKNFGQSISTIPSAGHDVLFQGRRIYPFKFLLKHYAFRSQKHAEKKVFRERKARWNPAERARGWHIHYDALQEGHQFVQRASEKELFDEEHFNKTYLVERLSGIGIHKTN